jgi:hypothetical protein
MSEQAAPKTRKTNPEDVLHVRVNELKPLINKWKAKNPDVPVTRLMRRALKMALKPLAGKRYAHLVEL